MTFQDFLKLVTTRERGDLTNTKYGELYYAAAEAGLPIVKIESTIPTNNLLGNATDKETLVICFVADDEGNNIARIPDTTTEITGDIWMWGEYVNDIYIETEDVSIDEGAVVRMWFEVKDNADCNLLDAVTALLKTIKQEQTK